MLNIVLKHLIKKYSRKMRWVRKGELMSWVKKFSALKMSSPFFGNEETFDFFSTNDKRFALVYGGNGTGKSTISDAFDQVKKSVANNVQFLDRKSKVIELKSDDLNNLLVFNEKYINDKIRIKEDGLESIVLLGENVDIDNEIEILKAKDIDLSSKIDEIKKWIEQYESKKTGSHLTYMKKCNDSLKKRWASVEAKIKGNKVNQSVNDTIVQRITTEYIVDISSFEEINNLLNEGLGELAGSENILNVIHDRISKIDFKNDSDNFVQSIKGLFEKTNKINIRTDSEIEIPDYISNNAKLLTNANDFLSDISHETCELCLQKITKNWRNAIMPIINQVLNEESKTLIKELNDYKLEEYNFVKYGHLKNVDEILFNSISSAVSKYNDCVNEHNSYIEDKISKLNEILSYDYNTDFKSLIIEINGDIDKFNQKIENINKVFLSRSDKKKELTKLNGELAYIEIIDDYNGYKKMKAEWDGYNTNLTTLDSEKDKVNDEIRELNMKLKNFDLAMNDVNESLSWMFCSDNRMALIPGENNEYKLLINGEPVTPSKISTGERNALALCYFFADIVSEEKNKEKYINSKMIIIDDPISSFDFGNKIGVNIVIKYKLSKFFKNNPDTKCILFTHDTYAAYNLFEIFKKIETNSDKGKNFCKYFELNNKKLIPENMDEKYSKYSNNIITIFEFIRSKSVRTQSLNTIGNILRVTIEMFCSFNYCEGIEKVLENENILKLLGDKAEYYQSLIMRLVLNEQSHGKSEIKFAIDAEVFVAYSEDELVRTAKDIIKLIDILNPNHIEAHLGINNNNKNNKDKAENVSLLKELRASI
jgi:wobble nucleotide-excising tRNase